MPRFIPGLPPLTVDEEHEGRSDQIRIPGQVYGGPDIIATRINPPIMNTARIAARRLLFIKVLL
jgi:hypothetical protein